MADDTRNISTQFKGRREIRTLEEYDEFIADSHLFANRSEGIRAALELQMRVHEILDSEAMSYADPRPLRHEVAQAVYDKLRRDARSVETE